MKVIVDTSVWSHALRRYGKTSSPLVDELADLIADSRAVLIGAIRQELLSGIKTNTQFELLRLKLAAFADLEINSFHYETAANYYNECRNHGVQGSYTDFLICAVSSSYDYPIFTTDKDFERFSEYLPIRLFKQK